MIDPRLCQCKVPKVAPTEIDGIVDVSKCVTCGMALFYNVTNPDGSIECGGRVLGGHHSPETGS